MSETETPIPDPQRQPPPMPDADQGGPVVEEPDELPRPKADPEEDVTEPGKEEG